MTSPKYNLHPLPDPYDRHQRDVLLNGRVMYVTIDAFTEWKAAAHSNVSLALQYEKKLRGAPCCVCGHSSHYIYIRVNPFYLTIASLGFCDLYCDESCLEYSMVVRALGGTV